MSDGLELTAEYRAEAEAITALNAPGIEVWAYGRRVDGTSYEASDLVLALRSADLLPVGVSVVSGLIDAFEEPDLPVIVDLHDWSGLPDSYRVRSPNVA